ncbi:hypothetical protein QR680_016689 [Steinernema hermaphroditum]|uniref:Uncharacterized protein n=1 Tax=Steinernema hermaphroditum TaxID=289476 RepID=A0AA39HE51_9BILA|nr:hypothetical protein QR680_016689 [Steinernema hermaphroditum]
MIRAVSIHRRRRNRSSSMPHRRLMATNSASTDAGTSTRSNASGSDVDPRALSRSHLPLQVTKSASKLGPRSSTHNAPSAVARLRSAALRSAEGSGSEVDLATMPSRRSRGRLKSAQYRKSIDFPTAVMQVARRASAIRGGEVATLSSTPTHDAEQKPENQRKKATVTEPDHAVFRLALPRVTVEGKRSLDASPTSSSSTVNSNAYNNSPHRRRVVDVSDHKTCALLMTKMKENSARSGSPLSGSQLVF